MRLVVVIAVHRLVGRARYHRRGVCVWGGHVLSPCGQGRPGARPLTPRARHVAPKRLARSTDRLALLKARQRRMAAAKGGNHAAVAAGRAPGALSAARSHEANEAYETSVGDALGALSLTGSAAGAGAGDLARSQAPPAPLAGEGAPCEPPGVARGRGALSKAAWLRGPRDAAGKRVDLSDRPLLAASAHGDSAVVAGSDHALYELTLGRAPKRARKLYTKVRALRSVVQSRIGAGCCRQTRPRH